MRRSVINFDVLRYVLAAAEIGKFGHAANALGVEPSTLSRKIDQLENELGLTIFERSHAGVRPTMGGKDLLIQVRRILADVEAIKASGRANGAGSIGEIRLGVRMPPVGEPIQSLLAEWRKHNPRVALKLYELNEREILSGIEERWLDVALITKHTLWPKAAAEPI
jgi:DNA-binding transcriptional LysR family regulator